MNTLTHTYLFVVGRGLVGVNGLLLDELLDLLLQYVYLYTHFMRYWVIGIFLRNVSVVECLTVNLNVCFSRTVIIAMMSLTKRMSVYSVLGSVST